MPKHGVYVGEESTAVSTPVEVETGVPFVVGLSPIQKAETPATVGIPKVCTTFAEFVEAFGWSEDWETYPLCEFAYSHFKLFGMQPAIFVNLLDPSTMKTAVAAADKTVVSKKVTLTETAIDSAALVVKAAGGNGDPYVKDTDYSVYFNGDGVMVVELLPDSTHYSEASLNIAYDVVTPVSVTAAAVAAGIDKVDLCMTVLGIVPDLLVSPKFSKDVVVAAVMAAKTENINGMFRAKALIDLDTSTVTTYSAAIQAKNSNNFTDENEIVCWPMVKLGDYKFHMSTQLAGLMAAVDDENGAPFASPSNNSMQCNALILADGTEVVLNLDQANQLNSNGIVTVLNFMGGFKAWGNYTACYPTNTDVKDYFIPVSRMFDWVANTLIMTFWNQLDTPMTRRMVDSIVDTANIWLNGLTGSGYILGGRCEMLESENPVTSLMAGIVKFHIYITPPSPAQEIDFTLEYDVSYLEEAFA
jgi:phage tail sheath protein FI